ncbi:MAG TPA: hypothetical protein VFJ85_17925 [Acidimicrobiales bacterium]|nr:hypothetical protein [Acidimicrobiales bacterium]
MGEEPPRGSGRWRRHAPALAFAAAALVAAVPYVAASPYYLREDFAPLHNVFLHGSLRAAGGSVSLTRPGAAAVFAVVFGFLGGHPTPAVALLAVVNAVSAALLYTAAARRLPTTVAVAVAAVWVLLPVNSSMTHWLSAAPVTVSLALGLGGVVVLWDRPLTVVRIAAAAGLFAAAGLTYEASLVLAPLAFVLGPAHLRRNAVAIGCVGAAAVGTGVWSLATTPKIGGRVVPAGDVLHGLFGSELVKIGHAGVVVLLLVMVASLFAAWQVVRPSFRPVTGERLVVAGWVVILAGSIPFLRYGQEISYVMQSDRAAFVSAIGAAMVLVGIGWMLLANRAVVVVLAAALAVGMVYTRGVDDVAYARSSRQVRQVLEVVRDARPAGRPLVVVARIPLGCGSVQAMNNDWNLGTATEWYLKQPLGHPRLVGALRAGATAGTVVDARPVARFCGGVGETASER